jgi:hypothetical protein
VVDGMIYLTKKDVETKVAAAKGGEALFGEKTFENKGWGPGPQYYKIYATKSKAKIVIKTKTCGKELVKEYPLSF